MQAAVFLPFLYHWKLYAGSCLSAVPLPLKTVCRQLSFCSSSTTENCMQAVFLQFLYHWEFNACSCLSAVPLSLSLSLSPYIYLYIYIYIDRYIPRVSWYSTAFYVFRPVLYSRASFRLTHFKTWLTACRQYVRRISSMFLWLSRGYSKSWKMIMRLKSKSVKQDSRLLYYLIREIKTRLNINYITVHNNTYCIF